MSAAERSQDTRKGIDFNLQESFSHSLSKQLLNSYYVPGPLLEASETNMNKKSYGQVHSLGMF